MKPFNLEAAKRGEPIVCRDGTPAKFVAHVPEAKGSNKVIALADKLVFTCFENGSRSLFGDETSTDLFMAQKKRTVWINIYGTSATVYCSEQDADKRAISWRIGNRAYPVEVEE